MSKFTQGEWKAKPHRIMVDGHVLATVNWDNNTQLIAAAPEMYELLKALLNAENILEINNVMLEAKELLERIDGKECEAE